MEKHVSPPRIREREKEQKEVTRYNPRRKPYVLPVFGPRP
jgi:hypothetical protein